jgi:hypothetical protein
MVTQDRIRLTGLLRKSPANAGLFYRACAGVIVLCGCDRESRQFHWNCSARTPGLLPQPGRGGVAQRVRAGKQDQGHARLRNRQLETRSAHPGIGEACGGRQLGSRRIWPSTPLVARSLPSPQELATPHTVTAPTAVSHGRTAHVPKDSSWARYGPNWASFKPIGTPEASSRRSLSLEFPRSGGLRRGRRT